MYVIVAHTEDPVDGPAALLVPSAPSSTHTSLVTLGSLGSFLTCQASRNSVSTHWGLGSSCPLDGLFWYLLPSFPYPNLAFLTLLPSGPWPSFSWAVGWWPHLLSSR